MNINNAYFFGSLLFAMLIISALLFDNNLSLDNDINYLASFNFIQHSYAQEDENEENEEKTRGNSIMKIAAVGDWDCKGETKDTVKNIVKQDPDIVLALGDLSYNGKAKCWLELIEPIADITSIAIGNHELDSKKTYKDYMEFFGLEEPYYSFNYKNMHFLGLSTETDYDDDSDQYEFAVRDLEQYSKEPFIDWIIVFYHKFAYTSANGLPPEDDFAEIYHPLFDKYKVDLALQGHLHAYERTFPITFNDDDEDEPVVQNDNPNFYDNPEGTIFLTVGTGGAHDMVLSSLDYFTAEGIDGDFGILDITLEKDRKTLTGKFIENGKKEKVLDEFTIVKD